MAKCVSARMDWLEAPQVSRICSVSSCISEDFGKWIDAWKHNGYWFFDSPRLISEVATELKIDLSGTILFYYEGFSEEYDADESEWVPYQPSPYFPVRVVPPEKKILRGFDVVTFSYDNSPECSPLSCNGLAAKMPVNEFCLLNSLEEAKALLEAGRFKHSEPGPYRVIAVYEVDASTGSARHEHERSETDPRNLARSSSPGPRVSPKQGMIQPYG